MSLEEKIVNVLGASDRPMKALDIARAIPGYEKKDVNRVIYNMREVERSNPGANPPLWRLYTGTVPTAATPMTPQARPQLQPQQPTTTTTTTTQATQGVSNSGAMGKRTGEKVPISDNHHGSAASLTDAMSKISIGDGASATWDDKLLATVEKTEDGGVTIRPIPREVIINRGTGDHSREADSAQGESLCPPVQESCSNEEIQTTSSLPKINPINQSSDHETTKGLDHYQESSENETKRKEYSSQVFDHTLQATGKSYSEAAQSRGSMSQPSSSSPPTDSKTKKKPTIAANFSGLGASSSIALKQKILEILKNENEPINSFTIAQRLGHSTRVEAMRLLQELKDEGKVSEMVRNEVSHWSIRE